MTPGAFIAKWRASELKESSAEQEHFIDLCRLALGLRNDVVNVELFTVVQAVAADRTAPVLLLGQVPLSPSREKLGFPGLSLFPIGAQFGVIGRRIVSDHDMPLDRRP